MTPKPKEVPEHGHWWVLLIVALIMGDCMDGWNDNNLENRVEKLEQAAQVDAPK
ncbi:MAG: hypothetical protein Q8R28_02150 [Dehalococcoidia bacterium]|nr:hypothetical protein [Dehalococcoidia bacterium]